MIISRTPYRISFFGGGTDYHSWYQEHGGQVLSTTINHYSYLHSRLLPPFFKHKYRLCWKQVEEVSNIKDIEHPVVKEALNYLNMKRGVEIQHQGSLPSRSGLGSSSTFTVGLLNSLYALRGEFSTKRNLACEAVHIERDLLKENVGVQDQIAAAYGGLNRIQINQDGTFNVDPVILTAERKKLLESNLLLFFTGISRTASDIAENKIKAIAKKTTDLNQMSEMVDQAIEILTKEKDIKEFGKLLDQAWQLKRGITSEISNDVIDDIYTKAKAAGAVGGKLLGAGGGGFMLFFVEPEKQDAVLKALDNLLLVPFNFENDGSKIIFYDPDSYSRSSLLKRDYLHLKEGNETLELNSRKTKLSLVK